MSTQSKKEMDLTIGSIFKKLTLYSIPFVFSNILQILFNTADIAVLGIFVGDDAVAAVGANSALSGLLVNLFVAFSIGANVVLARYVGARNIDGARRTVGTSILLALISGFILLAVGVPCAELFLKWMGCDPRVLDMATTYLRIYFLGMPIMMLYNFCASIMRAVGDSKRPLIFLSIGGVVNVVLNIFFVTVLKMTVQGVAIATIVSQAISVTLSLIVLLKSNGYASLRKEYLKISKIQVKEIFNIAIPSALQSLAFSASNVVIQSKVNSFGADAMAGATTAAQFDAVIYNIGNAVAMSCMAFVSQNIGAKNMERVKKTILYALLICFLFQFSTGGLFSLLSTWLCGLIANGQTVIEYARIRLVSLCTLYFLCGFMEVFGNSNRAMGKPVVSMIISVLGATVFRIIWLEITFSIYHTYQTIYISYIASWIVTIIAYLIMTPRVFKKVKMKLEEESQKK